MFLLPWQWKALKCQTLGKAVHVIVLVCWLESITVSWLSHACHAHYFVPAYAKFAHKFLTLFRRPRATYLYLSYLISIALTHFIAFSRKLPSAFHLDRKTWSQRSHACLPSYRHSSFTLQKYLCWRHTYCQWPTVELAMNVSNERL